jgi:hypothetical protein
MTTASLKEPHPTPNRFMDSLDKELRDDIMKEAVHAA